VIRTSVWRPPTNRGVNEHSSGSPTSLTTCAGELDQRRSECLRVGLATRGGMDLDPPDDGVSNHLVQGSHVEHCDAAGGVGPGEKEFLSLDDEITAVVGTRVHLPRPGHIGWRPDQHPRASPRRAHRHQPAGRPDAQGPLRNDEPTSLLTTDLVSSFLDAARGLQAYQGIKIQTPADASWSWCCPSCCSWMSCR
jgi:hypothetical protein